MRNPLRGSVFLFHPVPPTYGRTHSVNGFAVLHYVSPPAG